MSRHRQTFALILISFTILATVITAFRVRDFPRSDLKTSVRKQKCENCGDSELNLDPKLHIFKIDSGKRAYEDLKKAVREQQKQIRLKTPEFKFEFSHEDDDDDDDDDDDLKVEKVNFPRDSAKLAKTNLKTFKKSSLSSENDDDDTDDDDDDNDDDKTVLKSENLKIISDIKVTQQKSATTIISKQQKKKVVQNKDEDNDDDEDDDDEDDDDVDDKDIKIIGNKLQKDTKLISKAEKASIVHIRKRSDQKDSKEKNKKTQQNKIDDDDDDDDDDKVDDIMKRGDFVVKTSDITKKTQEKPLDHKHITQNDANDEIVHDKHNLPDIKKKEKADTSLPYTSSSKESSKSISQDTFKDKSDKSTSQKDNITPTKPIESIKQKPTESEKKPSPKKEKDISDKKVSEVQIKPEAEKETQKKAKSDHQMYKHDEHKSKKEETKETPKPKVKPSPEIKQKEVLHKEKKSTEKRDTKRDKTNIEIHDSENIVQRQEAYLKQVTDALHRRNLLQSEFEDFYSFFPTFAPNFSRIHNPECRRHGQILLRQLRGTKLWALNMLDSTAKIPSGILQGNGIQLGDFDQCVGSHARVQLESGNIVRVQGKYCLARIDIKAEHPELEVPVHLAQAKNLFKSRIDDPGHFVPRFSTLSWGVCVPAACNPEDVEVIIRDTVKHYQHTSGILVKVKVDEGDCHVEDNDWWEKLLETPTILTLSFYGVIILLVLIATIKDFLARRDAELNEAADGDEKNDGEEKDENEKQSDGFISAFSLYRTLNKLLSPGTTDDISCIHGVRGLATIALLVAHKILPVSVTPYTNRVKITEIASGTIWSWARAGWVFTDCFLLLSGALTAYRITVDSENSALKRIVSRYLRLTPALLAIVLFYTYLWDTIGSGPMWGSLVTKNTEVCQEGWWWNLLYVQNYFGFEDMCAPQTHQLALDMQLTLLSGIIVWCIHAKPGASKIVLLIIHGLTAYSRYMTVRDHRLTLIAYHGVSVSQLYRTARLTYTSTFHRSTAYLIGISLGLALQNPAKHGKIVLTFGWLISISLWSLVWWAGYDAGYPTYHYNTSFAAQYSALAPFASSIAIAWLIYAVHNGGDGFLSRLLCCWPLVLVSRLSYAVYLCQFVVYLTNAAMVRTSSEFTLSRLLDIQEISNIFLFSTLLTLTVVIPMQSLPKVWINWYTKEESDQEREEKVENPEETPEDNGIKTEAEDRNGIVEMPSVRRSHFIAHREALEEIPEVDIEYEIQRDLNDGLEEIIEEEEDEEATDRDLDNTLEEEEDIQILDDDMEVIEEELEEGGEDFWNEREEYRPRRSFRFNDDDDEPDELDYTANSISRNGNPQYRYSR